jgi:hypothetical protein
LQRNGTTSANSNVGGITDKIKIKTIFTKKARKQIAENGKV